MEITRITKLHFQSSLDEERPQTRAKILESASDFRRRGLGKSTVAASQIANIECDGLSQVLDVTLKKLEGTSATLLFEEHQSFWEKATEELKLLVVQESQGRKGYLLQQIQSVGELAITTRLLVEKLYGQQLSNILSRLGRRAQEIVLSHRIRTSTKRADYGVAPHSDQARARSVGHVSTEVALNDVARSYEYEVALSFAGEDREYVEEVAHCLSAEGVSMFYDAFEEGEALGKGFIRPS